MAKKKTETDRTETTLAQLKENQAALDAAAASMPTSKKSKKLGLAIPPKLMERAMDHTSKTHRVSVDLLGGSVAHVSTELINAAIRVSNVISFAMLFYAGYQWGKYTGTHRVKTGLVLVGVGMLLVLIAIPLGG